MNKPLWQPSEKLKENSLLKDFCKFINFKSSNDLKKFGNGRLITQTNFGQSFGIIRKLLEIRDLK